MTARTVRWVLDELGAVVDAQPDDHPLRRVDRDNALLYDGGGSFDMESAIQDRTGDFKKANYVGAGFADRDGAYIGTEPDLDLESVVGIRVEGYSGSYGHVAGDWGAFGEGGFGDGEFGGAVPTNGVVFHGADGALVEQIRSTLYDALKEPDAGRTDVYFTDLAITNETPAVTDWEEHFRYDFDIPFSGFEEL